MIYGDVVLDLAKGIFVMFGFYLAAFVLLGVILIMFSIIAKIVVNVHNSRPAFSLKQELAACDRVKKLQYIKLFGLEALLGLSSYYEQY